MISVPKVQSCLALLGSAVTVGHKLLGPIGQWGQEQNVFPYSFGGAVPVASSAGAGYFVAVSGPDQVGEGPVGVLVEMIDLWVLVPVFGRKLNLSTGHCSRGNQCHIVVRCFSRHWC